jgi:hypothetical protein
MIQDHIVSLSFAILYCLLGVYVIYQLLASFRDEVNRLSGGAFYQCLQIFSYRMIILITLVAYAFVRFSFWLTFALELDIGDETFYLLFFGGAALQLLSFLQLAVFLSKVALSQRWTKYRPYVLLTFFILAAADVIGTIIFSTQAGLGSDAASNYFSIGSSILFLTVGIVFACIAVLLRQLSPDEYSRLLLFHPNTVIRVTILLSVVLISRGIFDSLASSGIASIDITRSDAAADASAISAYFVWEFFPIAFLFFTIARQPKVDTSTAAVSFDYSFIGRGADDDIELSFSSLGEEVEGTFEGLFFTPKKKKNKPVSDEGQGLGAAGGLLASPTVLMSASKVYSYNRSLN